MKTYRVAFTPKFRSDLLEVVETIDAEAGRGVARRWNAKIIEQSLALRHMPFRGPLIGRGEFRRLVVTPYLIAYRVIEPDRVEMARVFDGRRDLGRVFAVEPTL